MSIYNPPAFVTSQPYVHNKLYIQRAGQYYHVCNTSFKSLFMSKSLKAAQNHLAVLNLLAKHHHPALALLTQ